MTTAHNTIYQEIPLDAGQVQGWKDVPIKEGGPHDPLVPLGPLSPEARSLTTSSLYFGEHSNSPYTGDNTLESSLLTLFARRSVAHRLLAAEYFLPACHHLLLFDVYRPYQVQRSLYDFYIQKLRSKHPDMNDKALATETQKYVSLPSTNPARPSPHNTGGSVDLAIVKLDPPHEEELSTIRAQLAANAIDITARVGLEMRLSAIMRRHGRMLNFGTAFDHGSEKAAVAYYELKIAAGKTLTDVEMRACNNRRLLYKIMTQAGFQAYFAEWWHFNAPESQMGAAAAGFGYATLGAMELTEDNKAHEAMRLAVYQEALKLQDGGSRAVLPTALQTEILTVISETGNPRTAKNWPAEVMAPPEE